MQRKSLVLPIARRPKPTLLGLLMVTLAMPIVGSAAELPPEVPLWQERPPYEVRSHEKEQLRSYAARPNSPSGLNRVYSRVSQATYSLHRPRCPNGVGLVICPGGGFRDVWIDREGHDLALWLKPYGVTCLVLKYHTRTAEDIRSKQSWRDYLRAVRADGWQAVRVLRSRAAELGLDPHKIGICGFSAGGHLALSCALHTEPKSAEGRPSGMPDFAGLFYPGIPDDAEQLLAGRLAANASAGPICPMFIINARSDELTPASRCVDFYARLLEADVNAELHVFGKGAHGFDLGVGRGKSVAVWPRLFLAWLEDLGVMK
ncbi:MAG: alpha/beta hydrolase [Verrucomicrobia bacterium]|nr:alpha/beta hydrolase [Verrucomicrobiota bacterium]